MEDGAFGISTGLYYSPQSYAKTEEVIELSRVAATKGGIYDTHMRDEGSYSIGLLGAIKETIRIGREAKIPVHISHIKALGPDVWGQSKQAIALIEKARREGVNVTANQYPYTASGTSLTAALVPRWAEAGGRDSGSGGHGSVGGHQQPDMLRRWDALADPGRVEADRGLPTR